MIITSYLKAASSLVTTVRGHLRCNRGSAYKLALSWQVWLTGGDGLPLESLQWLVRTPGLFLTQRQLYTALQMTGAECYAASLWGVGSVMGTVLATAPQLCTRALLAV